SEARKRRVFAELACQIDHYTIAGVSISVVRRDYLDVIAPHFPDGNPLHWDPYLWCLRFCVDWLRKLQDRGTIPNEPVALFFDQGHKQEKAAINYGAFLKEDPRFSKIVASFTTIDSRFPPVQPADMLAYLTTDELLGWYQVPLPHAPRVPPPELERLL